MNTPPLSPLPLFQTCAECGILQPVTAFQWTRKGRIAKRCHTCAFPPPPSDLTQHTCVRCGQTKPQTEFSRNKGRYPKSWCKACNRAYMQQWHEAHPQTPKSPRPLRAVKFCSGCGETKPRSAFYLLYRGGTRLTALCKGCNRKQSLAYYVAHREEQLALGAQRRERNAEKIRQWRRDNRHIMRDCDARRRARKKNAPRVERVDRAAIIARDNGTCYLCGAHPVGDDLTLDHVIPLVRGGSHTADNLRVCCRRCNSSKRSRRPEELRATGWLPPSET